jgi:APA family basic amino acid/polyamine antiporter
MTPLVDAARHMGGRIGWIVFIGSVVSVGGFTAGSALGAPRYAQAIAAHGQLPAPIAKFHARFKTPHVAILATTIAAALLALVSDYRLLVGFSNVTVVFQYALSCVAVIVLRRASAPPQAREATGGTYREAPAVAPPPKRFRVPFGPVLPILGAAGSVALLAGSSATEFIWAAAGIAVGVPLAIFSHRLFGDAPASGEAS